MFRPLKVTTLACFHAIQLYYYEKHFEPKICFCLENFRLSIIGLEKTRTEMSIIKSLGPVVPPLMWRSCLLCLIYKTALNTMKTFWTKSLFLPRKFYISKPFSITKPQPRTRTIFLSLLSWILKLPLFKIISTIILKYKRK